MNYCCSGGNPLVISRDFPRTGPLPGPVLSSSLCKLTRCIAVHPAREGQGPEGTQGTPSAWGLLDRTLDGLLGMLTGPALRCGPGGGCPAHHPLSCGPASQPAGGRALTTPDSLEHPAAMAQSRLSCMSPRESLPGGGEGDLWKGRGPCLHPHPRPGLAWPPPHPRTPSSRLPG